MPCVVETSLMHFQLGAVLSRERQTATLTEKHLCTLCFIADDNGISDLLNKHCELLQVSPLPMPCPMAQGTWQRVPGLHLPASNMTCVTI